MGSARTVTALELITPALYALRDPQGTDYNHDGAYAELLGYLNRCNELIYELLVGQNSEIVQSGSGSITTVAGTQYYSLSSNTMGDFWIPVMLGYRSGRPTYAIWISEYEPMFMCEQGDLYDAINANEGSTTARSMPDEFCLIAGNLWFNYVPDDAYTANLRYYPNFTPLSSTSSTVPYYNLFNNELTQGIVLCAKHRNELPISIDAALKDMFMARAMKITNMRKKPRVYIRPSV